MRTLSVGTTTSAVDCHTHGVLDPSTGRHNSPWLGDVECSTCKRVFICEEIDGKRVYSAAPDSGFCECGSWLFPRQKSDGPEAPAVFSARPICKRCGRLRVGLDIEVKEKKFITLEIKYTTILKFAAVAAAIAALVVASRFC